MRRRQQKGRAAGGPLDDRPLGTLQAIRGVGEVALGGALLATPEPTMLSKIAGVAMGAHGVDDVWTGLRAVWSGTAHESLTQQAATGVARGLGASPQAAVVLGMATDMAAGFANPEGRAAGLAHDAALLGEVGRAGHDVQGTERIAKVLGETAAGAGNLTSAHRLSAAEALDAGTAFLGGGSREIGKPGSGVFRSADGLRQFRIDANSLTGRHDPHVPHAHFEIYETPTSQRPVVNNHVPIVL